MKLRMIILSVTIFGAALISSGCSNPDTATKSGATDAVVDAVEKSDVLDGLDTVDTSKVKADCGCPPKKPKDEE